MAKKKVQTQFKVAKGKTAAGASERDSSGTSEVVVGKNAERKRREAIRRAKEKLKVRPDNCNSDKRRPVVGRIAACTPLNCKKQIYSANL